MNTIQQDDVNLGHLDLYAEQEGGRHIDKILSAVESEPLGVTLLQLAWTAGPLTYIALQGGYYLGYGKTAPFALFTYFAGYTLITGLFGLVIRIIYQAHQNTQSDQSKSNYLTTIDTVFRLTQTISDYRLNQLNESDRKMEASIILLSNTHALPAAIALGVKELTENRLLAKLSQEVELFRRAGLASRAKEVIATHSEFNNENLQTLLNLPSDASYFLKMRLEGRAPSLKEGMERSDGFLRRIVQAREQQNPSLMHLKDVEEFLTLVYELLNGRKIEFLTFTYTGKKKLRQSAKALEKTRASFRTTRAAFYAEIDKLYTTMVNQDLINDVKNFDFRIKLAQIFDALNHLSSTVVALSGRTPSTTEAETIQLFTFLVKRYTYLSTQYKVLLALEKQRQYAVNQWRAHSEKYSDRATRFRYGRGKKGLRIAKKTITLNDEAKRRCSNTIVDTLKDFSQSINSNQNLSALKIKQFIIKLTDKTNAFFDISNPIIHYGIESSKATNFGSLDNDSSIESRALWAAAMVRETVNNIDHAAEKLAKVLLYEYDEVIDDKAIAFLASKFGANPNNLKKFVKERNLSDYRPLLDVQVEIPIKPPKWDIVIKNAKKNKNAEKITTNIN